MLSMVAGEQCSPGAGSQLVFPSPVRGEYGVRARPWELRSYVWYCLSDGVTAVTQEPCCVCAAGHNGSAWATRVAGRHHFLLGEDLGATCVKARNSEDPVST